jgi:hypothetical protein
MRAILFKNGKEVRRGTYPRKDMALMPELKQGLEWKIIREGAIPSYDSRTHTILSNEINTNDSHPDYPHLSVFNINYTKKQKINSVIEEAYEKVEKDSNEQILKENKRLKFIVLGLGILIRKSNGITITAKEENILDKILTKATNVWHNDSLLKDKIENLRLGDLPDLDDGWNTDDE